MTANMSARSTRARPARASSCSTARATSSRSTRRSIAQITPKPGWVEHDAMEIWRNAQAVMPARWPKPDLARRSRRGRRGQPARDRADLDRRDRQAAAQRHRLDGHAHRRLVAQFVARRRTGFLARENRPAAGDLFLRPEIALAARSCPGARARAEAGDIAVRHDRYMDRLESDRRRRGGCTSPTSPTPRARN